MECRSSISAAPRWVATMPYLLAHFAKSQLWHASTLLFGFFLTEACGLDARTMGFAMAGSLVLNGVLDGVVGGVSDLDVQRAIRRQAWGAPATCLFFLLFCATPFLDPAYRVAWAMTTLFAFRATYPFIDVPQNAMVALIATGAEERCLLLARRNIGSGLASLAVVVLAAPLLITGRSLTAWIVWAGVVALLVCATAWMVRGPAGRPAGPATPLQEARDTPVAFRTVLVMLAVMMLACAAFRALEPYYAAYAGAGMGLLLWAAVGGMASQPLWVATRRRFGDGSVLVVAAAALTIAVVVLLGPSRGGPVGAAAIGLGFGVGTSGVWLVLWTATMTHAAAGRATRHVGAFTCVSKLAQAAAMLLLGQVLATSPYRTTLADPWSAPSLLMVAALVAIAGSCLGLAAIVRVNRTACDERSATPRPAGRTIPVPD
ncbi:hypothetical protein ASE70_14065 [Sphingomonas sp. Leaf22]|nr:hypothetical protein ASE70_14065 [Sphingomonas sp. Leaf22]